jgi:hypothetical protein
MLDKLASWLFFPVVLGASLVAGNNAIEAGIDPIATCSSTCRMR